MFIILIQCLLYFTTYYTSRLTILHKYCTCPLARPSPKNEQLPKLFYCTCVITDACTYTCRFVSTIVIHWHRCICTHTHMQHTYMHGYIHTQPPHTHMHTPPCAHRMDSFLCIMRARRGMRGVWRCSFRQGLQWTCRSRWKITIICSVSLVVCRAGFIVHQVPHNIQGNMKVKKYIQHIATGDIQFTMYKFICALEACTCSGLGMCFGFPPRNLGTYQ